MSASISPSNKCNITGYRNSINNGNNDKNSGGDSDSDSDGDNESDNRAKMTRTLINHKTTEYSGYCYNTAWLFVVDILIEDCNLYAETSTGLSFH